MKRIVVLLMACMIYMVSFAQHETDFAERYMQLYSDSAEFNYKTIGPKMMQKMQHYAKEKADSTSAELKQLSNKMRTLRIIENKNDSDTTPFFQKALKLVNKNKKRFQLLYKEKKSFLYVRKKDKVYVELLLLDYTEKKFTIINITGDIPPTYVKQLFER